MSPGRDARAVAGTTLPGRNDPCPCGSGRKFKACCGAPGGRAAGNPPQTSGALQAGIDALKAGRPDEAAKLFEAALHGKPGDPDAMMLLGLALARAGQRERGIATIREVIARRPTLGGPRLLLASVLRESGAAVDAIAELREAIRRIPSDATLHNELGLTYLNIHRLSEAEQSLRRAVALVADYAIAHYNLACCLERQRRFDDAAQSYRRAIAAQPAFIEALSRYGNLLHGLGQREAAMECFRRAFAAAPTSTAGRMNRVKLLLEEENGPDAERVLGTILAAEPGNSEALRLLGNLLRESGRFDEAVNHLTRAIELDPTQIAAYHDLAYCRMFTEAERPWIERMRARLNAVDLTDHERVLLHFAIGKGLDDLDDPAGAMAHFDTGNAIERRGLNFDRAAFAAAVDNLIARFTPETFAAHAGYGRADPTPVLVLGMPRSGTTLVEQVISSHPAVAGGGELRFWNERGAPALAAHPGLVPPETLRAIADEYAAILHRIGPAAARVTDKMPFNFLWIGFIHLAFPQARFVHCRRDPLDTCLSIYFLRFAIRQDFAYDRDDLVFYYRQYTRLMAHWREVLPPGHLIEVDYESLVAAPEVVARRLIDSLDLPWDDACLRPELNRRTVRTASMWQARQPIYRSAVARWRRYEPWLGALRDLHPAAG